nr:prepilin-type N-terminal cleavage/methylation domain-containing protein [Lysobacter ruishenii]
MRNRRPAGFSLIEVMVAVVVLATGLLALAALQGALARNSADAKARGAIMAALNSRMNDIRQAPPAAGQTWTTADAWVGAAAIQAGASDLKVEETVATYRWNGTGYVTTAVTNPPSSFTRASLEATWKAANGDSRVLGLTSDVSGRIYGDGSGYPVPDPTGSASKRPIVRQGNPSNTPGVIPIVTGNQATAASNPQPIIVGASEGVRVGTSFDVLNYIPEGSTAQITKRFETQVIKCRCSYGAGGGYTVAGAAQWPAVWDGSTYATYEGTGNPAGVAANAGEDPDYVGKGKKGSGRLQSEQCTECCRDHHDLASNTNLESRYDPEATAVGKFNEAGGVLTATSSGAYVAACRVMKLDGIWKTTADTYQRHYGLLETLSVGGVQAKSGIPTSSATSAYQTFVKDFLSQYTSALTPPAIDAQTMFDESARGLNAPATVTIAAASTSDYRYLHGRGLYLDYLGSAARQAIGTCSGKTGVAYTECVLPILPFTTINLTEMARWTASDTTVLNVNSTKALSFNVTEPFGGRTAGIKTGTANNNSVMRTSNSGVAVSDDIIGAVDTNGDGATLSDSQSFQVGAGTPDPGPGTGDKILVAISGGSSSATPKFDLLDDDNVNCTFDEEEKAWSCPSDSTLPVEGTLTLSGYNLETLADYTFNPTSTAGCTRQVGDNGSISSPNVTIGRPQFTNYEVLSVTGGGTPEDPFIVTDDGKSAESTKVTLSAIPKYVKSPRSGLIQVTLQQTGSPTQATLLSCVYKKNGSNATIVSISWTKPWL